MTPMKERDNPHQKLLQLLDCYLEADPAGEIRRWAGAGWPAGGDMDEAGLKYIALVLLDSIGSGADKAVLEMGCPALVDAGDDRHMLAAAPESMLARGLELVREMCGLAGAARGDGLLMLGLGSDSLELMLHKSEGLHIFYFPRFPAGSGAAAVE